MRANVGFTRQAGAAPGAVISGGPGRPAQPRSASRQRDAILIVTVLAVAVRVARDRRTWQHVIMFVIALAAAASLASDSQARSFARLAAWDKRRKSATAKGPSARRGPGVQRKQQSP